MLFFPPGLELMTSSVCSNKLALFLAVSHTDSGSVPPPRALTLSHHRAQRRRAMNLCVYYSHSHLNIVLKCADVQSVWGTLRTLLLLFPQYVSFSLTFRPHVTGATPAFTRRVSTCSDSPTASVVTQETFSDPDEF